MFACGFGHIEVAGRRSRAAARTWHVAASLPSESEPYTTRIIRAQSGTRFPSPPSLLVVARGGTSIHVLVAQSTANARRLTPDLSSVDQSMSRTEAPTCPT